MALEQNDIRYGVDIDLQDSIQEIDKFRSGLKNFGDDLAADATKVQQRMKKAASDYVDYIRSLQSEIDKLKKKGKDATAVQARLNQVYDRQNQAKYRVASNNAQGSDQTVAMRSAFTRQINEIRSSLPQLTSKYFEDINKMYLNSVRRSLTDMGAEETLLRRSIEDRQTRARVGDAAFGFAKQRERRQLNGGANQFLSQAGILNNYALVGGAYSAAYGLGGFIVNLDKEFKQFQAITASTNNEMKLMEERLLSVSETSKFTANEIAEAATQMGQAGLSAGDVAEAIEPVTKLATAAGTELKDAVDVVTSSLNIFNLQTSQAGHLADVFTAALNESKLTLDQLSAGLQYAGNTAASVGVNYNELTAAIGALANAGIRSGSTIGTGLRQLLVDLITPSKNLKAELARLGLSLEDIDIKTHGLAGVMQNLKTAGFDTSAAFEGLEVRAAAAYTALSNNLDTMSELRQSFLLSNAATEASDKQMESLANTAKNFGSNLGALVYTALQPFVKTLQMVMSVGSQVLPWLRSLGPAVQVVGTSFAIFASALIVKRVGLLVAGLIGIGTAASGAATAMSLLRAATIGNPLFFGAAVLITGIQLLSNYTDRAGRLAATLDQLKTEQNEYQASVDHTNDRIASLDSAMEDLIRKQKNLDTSSNSTLRKTTIMEVLSTFQELTGEIDASTASIADLIVAMQHLKTEMASGLPDEIGLLVDKIDERIAALRQGNKDEATGHAFGYASIAASRRFGNGGAITSPNAVVFNELIAKQFGEEASEAFKISTNQVDPNAVDPAHAKKLQTGLERQLAAVERKLRPLDEKGYFGRTDEEQAKFAELSNDLTFLRDMAKAFKPIVTNLTNIGAAELEREVEIKKQAKATLANTPSYQKAGALNTATQGYLSDRSAEIFKADLSIEEEKKAMDALGAEVGKRVTAMNDLLTAAAEEMRKSGEFTEEQIQEAVNGSDIKTDIAALNGSLRKSAEGSNKAFDKLQEYLLKRRQKVLEGKINSTKNELADATNERQVDLLEKQLYSLNDQLAKVELDVFDASDNKNVGDDPADLERAKREIRDGQQDRKNDLIKTVIEKRADLAKKANDVYEDNLNDQLKRVQDEMKNLAQSINNDSTADYIKTAKEKLDELNAEAKRLAGEIAGISVSHDFSAFTAGGLPSANATDIQRQIIDAANKAGIPPQYALALSSFETGGSFNPNAKNPKSSAAGLFQNTDANWASHGLTPGDRSSVAMQIFAGIDDMKRTQKALGSTQLSFRDYYASHLLGQAGYKSVLASPHANAVSLLGTDAVANNGGNLTQTASEFVDMIVAKAAVHLEKVKGLVQRPMDAADDALETQTNNLTEKSDDAVREFGDKVKKNQTKATVKLLDGQAKALEAQINTLLVQSSKAQDPEAIQSIIDQVRSKWTDLAKKEIDSFTAENAGTDDFDQRLSDLKDNLNAALSGKIVTLLDRYQQAIESTPYAPLQDAQAKLEAAQNPLNAGKFTDVQVQGLQHNVQLQERAAQLDKLNQLEQLHTYITQQVSAAEQQYGINSQMVQALKERQYSVEQSLTDVRRQAKADTDAASQSEVTLKDAIVAANVAWAQRNGLLNINGDPTTGAERVGEAWGQALDGIANSMGTVFSDLATGSEKAGEAFRKFGLSVIQMLIQMIAKALVFNIIQSALGGATGGASTGNFGKFLTMLLGGTTGAATGAYIPGVKRASGGEYITGSSPFRDSELRRVMPGEMILRASAVNQIGRDSLEKVNALGNRRIANGMPSLPSAPPADQRPINVWAVLPEEKPQVGPNDVVAYIGDDIRRRGVTRTLIKSIVAGKM